MGLPAGQFVEDGCKFGGLGSGDGGVGLAHAAVKDARAAPGKMLDGTGDVRGGMRMFPLPLGEGERDGFVKFTTRRSGSGKTFYSLGEGGMR